jgi:hypothetical protein
MFRALACILELLTALQGWMRSVTSLSDKELYLAREREANLLQDKIILTTNIVISKADTLRLFFTEMK